MKKIASIILGLVAIFSVNAANTEVARLTITGQGGTESSFVTLRIDPDLTDATTTSFFENTDLIGNVNIYALYNANKYSALRYKNLNNLSIGIITNRRAAADQHYTITFNVPTSTVGMKLYDLAVDPAGLSPINITDGGTYEFDVNTTLHPDFVAGTNYTIANRFVVNYVPNRQICHRYGKLQITDCGGMTVKVLNMDGSATSIADTNITSLYQEIDLAGLAAGQYKVEYNDGTAHTVIIKVQ